MNGEIKALREEVARLRERVAVLESRQQVAPYTGPITPWPVSPYDQFNPPSWMPPFVVTCASGAEVRGAA
jgi:hypothetical protein